MNKALVVILWLFTIAFSYWLGLRQNLESDEFSYVEKELSNVEKNQNANQVVKPIEAFKNLKPRIVDPDIEDKTEIEIPAESNQPVISERLSSSNPVVRLQAFTELLKNPTEENLNEAIDAYNQLPEGPSRFSELRLLTFSWAQVDPTGAMDWVKSLDGFEQRIGSGSIMDSWARYDADGAIAWANENFEGAEGSENPYFVGIISGMAENNLVGATDLMTELPFGRVRGRAVSVLFEQTWRKGEDVAMHWAENLPEGSIQNFAYQEIAEKIIRDDLGRAVQWVETMEESEVKTAVSEDVAEKWARKNPIEAAQWVEQMPEGEARSESMEEVVTQWARKDPTATADWLNKFPSGELMDEPIQRFVREVVRSDPEIALTWAEAIVDEERKAKTILEVEKVADRLANQKENSGNNQVPSSKNKGPNNGKRKGPPLARPQ